MIEMFGLLSREGAGLENKSGQKNKRLTANQPSQGIHQQLLWKLPLTELAD